MNFLKGGESKDPIDLLKMAGVDMTTEKPVADALALFGELVAELEALVWKAGETWHNTKQ